MRMRKLGSVLALGLWLMAGATVCSALSIGPSGEITNWGFTPFGSELGNWANGSPPLASGAGAIDVGENATTAWVEGNNAAPLDYPGGPPDFVPSPAGVAGEGFDNELLAWRNNGGGRISVLGITSMNPDTGTARNSSVFHLGDVFVDVDGNKATGVNGYEFALTAGQWSTPLNDPLSADDDPNVGGNQVGYGHNEALGLYSVDTAHGVTNQGGAYGSYNNPAFPDIPSALNPFSLRSGTLQAANLAVDRQSFDYGLQNGSDENGTWILEWTFDIAPLLALLPTDPTTGQKTLDFLTLHWSTECGNDFLDRGPRQPPIPEPATLALMGLGLASIGMLRRRMRRA